MLLDILRDGLGEELTTDEISRRELALDKELIQLIQNACKNDKLARALDLTKLLHLTASFDMAIKVAGFYHLIGLQEKMEALKEDREDRDRLADAREKRRQRTTDLAPVPATRYAIAEPPKSKAFQDFRPPPVIHRPGLERATPSAVRSSATTSAIPTTDSQMSGSTSYDTSFADSTMDTDYTFTTSPEKRKRAEEEEAVRESYSPGRDIGVKRRAVDGALNNKTPSAARKSWSIYSVSD